jgi:hypothetical protein
MGESVLLVAAEDAAGDMVAGALNLSGARCLYGRQWGSDPTRPEVKGLHFEACYYQAIEEAIARGLPRVEAGAQGEHKLGRGYLPTYTYRCVAVVLLGGGVESSGGGLRVVLRLLFIVLKVCFILTAPPFPLAAAPRSAHYLRDPVLASAVARFLDQEAQQVNYTWQALTIEGSPFKKDRTLSYLADKAAAFSSLSSSGGSLDEGGGGGGGGA